MRTLATALLASVALLVTVLPVVGGQSADASSAVKFGMDSAAISAQTAAGVAPDYGTFWIGPWTLSSGWGGPDGQLTTMKNAGVTPAIHFYYWGDDISPNCVENGCWSSLHNAQKTRQGWETLGTQLTDHLNSKMGGEPVVIFLESEFNKGGIETYEPFDGYMAAMADKIHAAYPSAIIVLGFGNWGSTNWKNFDHAATASDMVGIQGMRGSTKQSQTDMYTLYDGLLAGVKTLETTFPGTPIMLTDIAVSSYPEPSYLGVQSGVLKEVFDNLAVLKSHGVEAMIYRSWKDSPNMDTANYYGEAERHWGMAWAGNGTQKTAGKVWVDGVKAERAGPAPVNNAPSASFVATGSQLTVSVDASSSTDADGQPLTYAWAWGDGASATGKTATHAYAAAGTYTIALTVSDGSLTASASKAVTVTKPVSTTTTTSSSPTSSTTTTTSTAYSATVSPSSSSNEWWVQAGVSPAPAKVEAKAGSGSWVVLDKQSYGWTKSFNVPKGTMVQFRVTSSSGQTATTPAKAWLVDMSPQVAKSTTSSTTTTTSSTTTTTSASTTTTSTTKTTTSSTSTTTASFRASFTPKSVGNDWWVESAVTANQPIAKVEAKVNSGAWVVLPKQDWGNYAKSINSPNGAHVTFRATSTTGAQYSSVAYTWT